MNQRVKRSAKGKGLSEEPKQNLRGATLSTGSHVVKHDRGENVQVKSLQKATGDADKAKQKGLAKASPFFKRLKDKFTPQTKEDEAKTIAQSRKEVKEDKTSD